MRSVPYFSATSSAARARMAGGISRISIVAARAAGEAYRGRPRARSRKLNAALLKEAGAGPPLGGAGDFAAVEQEIVANGIGKAGVGDFRRGCGCQFEHPAFRSQAPSQIAAVERGVNRDRALREKPGASRA